METTANDMTPAEWELMRLVWTKGDSYSSDLIKLMQEKRDWADSTIKTLLRRLVAKEALAVTKEGRRFRYHAVIGETKAMTEAVNDLFDQLCNMKKGVALADLLTTTELSRADIERLQAILAAKLPDAPEKVTCNCLPTDEVTCGQAGCTMQEENEHG